MKFLSPFAILLAAIVSIGARGQTAPSLQAGLRNPVKPFRTLKAAGPVVVDTRRFFPQIAPIVQTPHEIPENPPLPLAAGPGEGNSLPLGGMLDQTRGSLRSHFPGISATGWHPADPTIAVGPNNVVETVNMTMAFYAKDGTLQLQQPAQTFFAGLGAGSFQFDPRVVYDRTVQRWVIMYGELDQNALVSKILIGVSQTSDPNGLWNTYRVEAKLTIGSSSYWMDYPSLGYNADGVIVCGNMFGFSSGFAGVEFVVLPKAPMLVGSPVTASYIRDSGAGSAQLADSFDASITKVYGAAMLSTSSARIYAFSSVGGTPTMAFASVIVPSFVVPAGAAPSTPGSLDTIDSRIFSATWRSGHLFASHNVSVGGVNQVRWYDFNLNNYPTGTPTLGQSGNIVPTTGGQHFHMGAIGSNGYNDSSAIFTRSSTAIPADAMFAGRFATDSPGSIGAPVLLESSAGTGYGGTGTNRWGDYFRCVVDPVDDATFWGVAMTGLASGDWRADIYSWTVTPPANLLSNALLPTVQGGAPASGTSTLDRNAPQYGYAVSLNSSNPAVASVPSSVSVAGGSSWASYTVSTTGVASDTPVTITASLRGLSRDATITVLAPRLSGTIALEDFTGTLAGRQVTIEVRNLGSTTALDTYTTTLDGGGNFAVITHRLGSFDVAIKGSHWLRKVVSNVTFTGFGAAGVNAALVNGDINGDNTVGLADFSALRLAFGSTTGDPNWNANADLNGDGNVGLADFSILKSRFGQIGDS